MLGAAVRRTPGLVVGVMVALTVVMLVLSGQALEAVGDEGLMPDMPAIDAAETLADRFGGNGDEVIQVLVGTDADTLVSAAGYAAAAAIEHAVRSAAGDQIADGDGRPGV